MLILGLEVTQYYKLLEWHDILYNVEELAILWRLLCCLTSVWVDDPLSLFTAPTPQWGVLSEQRVSSGLSSEPSSGSRDSVSDRRHTVLESPDIRDLSQTNVHYMCFTTTDKQTFVTAFGRRSLSWSSLSLLIVTHCQHRDKGLMDGDNSDISDLNSHSSPFLSLWFCSSVVTAFAAVTKAVVCNPFSRISFTLVIDRIWASA